MTTELKSCPFCGGEASTWAQVTLHPPGFEIECDSCGASTSADFVEDKVREAWNTRTADKEIERLREALHAWVIYDDGDWSDDTTGMIATYKSAITATRAALGEG